MRVLALAAALAITPSMACADDSARFVSFKYRPNGQVTLACSAALLCTLSFAKNEQFGDYFVSDPIRWRIQTVVAANTPELVAQAETPGLRANLVVFSRNTGRQYRVLLESVTDPRPLYASFVFPEDSPARKASQKPPKPRPKPVPPTIAQIMDKACATQTDGFNADGATDKHGHVDPVLASMRPVHICGDGRHTYLQMPLATAAVSDLPVPFEDALGGPTQVNYHYAEHERIFTVDTTGDVVLKLTIGKRIAQIHVHRVAQP